MHKLKFSRSLFFDIVSLLTIILCVWKYTFALEHFYTVGFWDELIWYIPQALRLPHELPPPEYAPLYSLWYWILFRFSNDALTILITNYKILILLIEMLLYLYLRRLNIKPWAALIAVIFLLFSRTLTIEPYVNYFAIVLFLLALIYIIRLSSVSVFMFSLGILFFTMSYVRPEFTLSYYLTLILFGFYTVKKLLGKKLIKKELVLLFILFCGPYLIFKSYGSPNSDHRFVFTFASAHCINFAKEYKLDIEDITFNAYDIKDKEFPNLNNIYDLFSKRRDLVFKHITTTFPAYATKTLCQTTICWNYSLVNRSCFLIGLGQLLLFLCLMLLFYNNRNKISFSEKETLYFRRNLIAFSLLVIPSSGIALLLNVNERLLIPQGILLFVLIAFMIEKSFNKTNYLQQKKMYFILLSSILFTITPIFITQHPFIDYYLNSPETKNGAKRIRSLQTITSQAKKPLTILTYSLSYKPFVKNINGEILIIDYKKSQRNFMNYLSRHNINIIIADYNLKNTQGIINNPEFHALLLNPEKFNYTSFLIPGTKEHILVRNDIFNQK